MPLLYEIRSSSDCRLVLYWTTCIFLFFFPSRSPVERTVTIRRGLPSVIITIIISSTTTRRRSPSRVYRAPRRTCARAVVRPERLISIIRPTPLPPPVWRLNAKVFCANTIAAAVVICARKIIRPSVLSHTRLRTTDVRRLFIPRFDRPATSGPTQLATAAITGTVLALS